MEQQEHEMFAAPGPVRSERILYTASAFAKTNLLYLQETGSLTAQKPHTSRREKLLSFLCFAVLKGSGSLEYENRTYRLCRGDLVFIDCRRPYAHSTDREEMWTLRWCHFYGPSAQAIYAKYCEYGGGPVIRTQKLESYLRLFDELYDTAGSDDFVRDMRIHETLSRLLTCLMSESRNLEAHEKGAVKRRDIQQIKLYLDERYQEKLTLESAAETFFINKHYLARLFKEQYGVTLTAYLQQVRITHAKHLLRFTDKKVEEIRIECGMGALPYFSRVFKKMEGISPSEYRKSWLG